MADIGPWDTDENIISNVTALQTDMAAAEADIDDLEAISADRDEPTGFVYADPDTIPVTLSFVNGTRTLTVAPSASTFSFYVEGVKYTKNASETIVIANTEGAHFIYYDENGDLASTTTWSIDIIMKYAYVAAIYWDATNAKQIYLGYECHGVKMDGHTHSYLHESRGSQLESGGGGVGGISSDDAVPDADSTKFSVTQAEFWDEDVHITLNAKGTGDNIALYYKSGADASDIWRVDESAVNVCLATGGVGENRAAYNQNNGGTWQLTECTDNYYVLAHVFAFNDQTRKFGIIIGQNEYSSKLNAREGAITELQTLDLRGVLTQEIKMLATIIVHTKETYSGNAIYSRVVTTDGGEDFIDWRNSPLPQGGTSSTVTDHGALGGLDDTDHPASAIFTDTSGWSGLLSASDTTVQAALDTLDALTQDAITSGSASATITADGLDITDGSTSVHINISSGDLVILNSNDGGDVYIKGEVATDTEKTIFKGAPDGAAELYYAGTAILATTAAGISITDGTATAATIGFSEDDLIIDNNDVAGLIILKGEKTGPSEVTLASFNPDGAAELYYAGTKIFETLSNGIKIPFSASASLEITPSGNGVDFYSEYQGAPIKFRARNGADSADVTLISMDSNDTITMYHQGTAVFQLLSNGLAVNGGGGIATGFNFTVSNPDVTILNKWDGGDVYIKGEVATDTEKTMAKFAPDGAVELYYAGTIALDTNADGISVYDDTGRQGSFGNTQGSDLFVIRNDVTSGNLAIQVKDSGENYDNILAGDADGATKLYYAGVLTMDTFSGGIYVRDSAGINANSIYNDGADFWFKNRIDGGDVYITGEVATNTEKTIFKGAPDGAAELYYAGTAILATTAAGISITDGTATAATIGFSADDLIIANNDPDGVLKLQAEKTGTGQSVLFSGDPDGAAYLYHAGVNVFQTTSVGGILVFNSNGESALFCNDGSDLILKNNKDGGDIYIKGDTTVPATKICAKFAPDGAAELYYAGTKVFETTAAGISITDGTATAATIDFSSDDLYIKNNDADGHIYVSANDGYIFFQNAVGANEARVVIGASDSQQGVLQIMGDTTGSTIGGYIILNTAADHDSYINYFGIQVISDDMNIGPGDANCLKFVGDGAVANGGQWQLYYTMYMADEVKMQWDDNPATDLTGVGDTIVVTVDQNTVGVGGILRQENAGGDGNFDDGDKDAATTAGRLVMAVESGTGNKEVLERGYMRNDAWSWTPGEQLFLGDSGAITDATGVAAFGSGDIIQVIGYAHTATVVYFNPSPTYDEVA